MERAGGGRPPGTQAPAATAQRRRGCRGLPTPGRGAGRRPADPRGIHAKDPQAGPGCRTLAGRHSGPTPAPGVDKSARGGPGSYRGIPGTRPTPGASFFPMPESRTVVTDPDRRNATPGLLPLPAPGQLPGLWSVHLQRLEWGGGTKPRGKYRK
jgi:hypothetical protein